MYISSATDPIIPIVSSCINDLAKEAIEWFDQVKNIEQLSHTIFTFRLLRYIDRKATPAGIPFFIQNKFTYKAERAKCIAFDQVSNKEKNPNAISSVIDSIDSLKVITQPIFALLTQDLPQEIQQIKLHVELFDYNNNSLGVLESAFCQEET